MDLKRPRRFPLPLERALTSFKEPIRAPRNATTGASPSYFEVVDAERERAPASSSSSARSTPNNASPWPPSPKTRRRLERQIVPTSSPTACTATYREPRGTRVCQVQEDPCAAAHENNFRSSERYWIASRMSFGRMSGAPARSARVRATFRIRSWARAEKFISSIACSR